MLTGILKPEYSLHCSVSQCGITFIQCIENCIFRNAEKTSGMLVVGTLFLVGTVFAKGCVQGHTFGNS